jgi:glycosyltransferase involved in cell wall biosynthesis
MKISIITPSYNQGKYIKQTIESVVEQDYSNVEHLVIDGGSKDETVEVLKRFDHLKWISEKDGGQADALNKGLKMASGEIIGWINSDDYYRKNIFGSVIEQFRDPDVGWVIGGVSMIYNPEDPPVPLSINEITHHNLLSNPDIVRQQATFFRRSLLEKVGAWDASFHMVMDLDLWFRLSKVKTPVMVNDTWAYFRTQPDQKTSYKNFRLQVDEILRLFERENAPDNLVNRFIRLRKWYLFKAYIKKVLLDLGVISQKYSNRPFRSSP